MEATIIFMRGVFTLILFLTIISIPCAFSWGVTCICARIFYSKNYFKYGGDGSLLVIPLVASLILGFVLMIDLLNTYPGAMEFLRRFTLEI